MAKKSDKLSAKSTSAPPTLRRRSPRASSTECLNASYLRTSPRWSSTPSKIEATVVGPGAKRRQSKSDALALSMYIIGNEGDEVPRPLKTYNPNEKSRRRSPRFAGHSCGSVSKQLTVSSDLNLPHALSPSIGTAAYKCLRRSPRLSLETQNDGSGVILGRSVAIIGSGLKERSDLLEKRRRSERKSRSSSENDVTAVGEKRLRSRVVPAPVVGAALPDSRDEASSKKVKIPSGGSDVGKVLEKCSRRSPRLSSSSVGVENNNVKFDLLALPAPSSSEKYSSKKKKTGLGRSDVDLFGKKCLRSRTIPLCLDGTENEVVKSSLIESIDLSLDTETPGKTKITSHSSVLDMPGEKCLRSRKIQRGPVGTENVEVKSSLVVLSDNLVKKKSPSKIKMVSCPGKQQKKQKRVSFFIGEPVPEEEARERWRWRYELKSQHSKGQSWKLNADEEDEIILNVQCHYTQAQIDGCILNIGDCAYIKGNGREKYVGRILEFFKTLEGEDYFRVKWFYRAQDTILKDEAAFHDEKRIFYSTVANDNLLDCIVSKVTVVHVSPKLGLKVNSIPSSDFYYDMEYCVDYSTFRTLLPDNSMESHDSSSPNYNGTFLTTMNATPLEDMPSCEPYRAELRLLDLYSGCGGMSTGLCLGAKLSSVNLVTRWAVDFDKSACVSLKLNHPEAQVRNESAEDFLELLKGWEKLCKRYAFCDLERTLRSRINDTRSNLNSPSDTDSKNPSRECEYEVSHLVAICYGDPDKTGKRGLKFKVHWKGYDSDEDTWEPIEGLRECEESIQDFVKSGIISKILPLPGDVDVICGGPPCQGISGYNRFRNIDAPLDDERNRQIIVFMDIVKFLKPKYVLMENVVDILRLNKGSLGRYALSRLVHMKYQARLGTIAAGCYGLPQFRLRVFIWGALPSEKLPQFPLPTHDVIVRYWPPPEFERNIVAYEEGQPRELEEAVILRDAISDLPAVTSHEIRDKMTYQMPPATKFQKYIRLTKYGNDIIFDMKSVERILTLCQSQECAMMGFASSGITKTEEPMLYDHRPYQLSEDDYLRVCQIPHQKGANFRDLPGVVMGADNTAYRDQTKEQITLPSGKPLVPDYVFTFDQGKSKRPFARLWWDETVATVLTFPSLHNQAVLHPEQDRVLTVREFARLQGFPDFYRLCGTVKERYCQVGNAVAVPVGRALGYTLGMAFRKMSGNEPLMTLPPNFSFQTP